MSKTTAVYIASSKRMWSEAEELAYHLRERGFVVTSRWHETAPHPNEGKLHRTERQSIAIVNAGDLRSAHAVVYLADSEARGALVEVGMILGLGRCLVIVGHPDDVSLMVDQPRVGWVDARDRSLRMDGRFPDAIIAKLPPPGLTGGQQSVLGAIREHVREKGYAPSQRELCALTGMASTNAISEHLDALEAKGHVRRASGKPRALVVLDPPQPPGRQHPTASVSP